MVCGSLGELTKLRAYSFQFWFQVLRLVKVSARVDGMTHTTILLAWELTLIFYMRHLYVDRFYEILRYMFDDFILW